MIGLGSGPLRKKIIYISYNGLERKWIIDVSYNGLER